MTQDARFKSGILKTCSQYPPLQENPTPLVCLVRSERGTFLASLGLLSTSPVHVQIEKQLKKTTFYTKKFEINSPSSFLDASIFQSL